jgi:hypothetical protein
MELNRSFTIKCMEIIKVGRRTCMRFVKKELQKDKG